MESTRSSRLEGISSKGRHHCQGGVPAGTLRWRHQGVCRESIASCRRRAPWGNVTLIASTQRFLVSGTAASNRRCSHLKACKVAVVQNTRTQGGGNVVRRCTRIREKRLRSKSCRFLASGLCESGHRKQSLRGSTNSARFRARGCAVPPANFTGPIRRSWRQPASDPACFP
jgi:hypothetical protein